MTSTIKLDFVQLYTKYTIENEMFQKRAIYPKVNNSSTVCLNKDIAGARISIYIRQRTGRIANIRPNKFNCNVK